MPSGLAATADILLNAVADALSDDLRPVCKAYQTHGIPVIFMCCECEDDEEANEVNGRHSSLDEEANDDDVAEVPVHRLASGGSMAGDGGAQPEGYPPPELLSG